jgi:hypothetical protein
VPLCSFRLDFTKGVLQCIGVKQFQQYLELSEDSRRTEKGRKALEEALTAMKYVTKKYARRQMRWINNRFLKSGDKQVTDQTLSASNGYRWGCGFHKCHKTWLTNKSPSLRGACFFFFFKRAQIVRSVIFYTRLYYIFTISITVEAFKLNKFKSFDIGVFKVSHSLCIDCDFDFKINRNFSCRSLNRTRIVLFAHVLNARIN